MSRVGIALLSALVLICCGGQKCGPGTGASDDLCVPDSDAGADGDSDGDGGADGDGGDSSCAETDSRPCATACGEGVVICSAGVWGPCSAPAPEAEICDTLDNDCDGEADEGLRSWHLELIDHVPANPSALVLGPDGAPRIAYLDSTFGTLEIDLVKLATRVGEGWQTEPLATRQGDGVPPGNAIVAQAVDGDGGRHVVWVLQPGGLHYLYSAAAGDAWVEEVVVPAGPAGGSLDVTVDSVGGVHVCFQAAVAELWYALRGEAGWFVEPVALGEMWTENLFGADCSIAVAPDATPHITYPRESIYDAEDFELHHAWRSEEGWELEVVDSDSPVGADSSLAIDAAGGLHVSYRTYEPLIDLRYAWSDGAGWTVETVDGPGEVGGFTSLALDPSGVPHITYHDWGNGSLRHAYREAGLWTSELVDGLAGDVRHSSLAADPDGGLHLSYSDPAVDELRYGRWDCCTGEDCPVSPWSALPVAGAPAARTAHSAVWTGDEMIVWGGHDNVRPTAVSDSGAWSPGSGLWRSLAVDGAPAPRWGHSAVWTGSEMVVWGGWDGESTMDDGARYDPLGDSWLPLPADGAPSPRRGHVAVWTGSEMLVWGGVEGQEHVGTGGRWDPLLDAWSPLPLSGAPSRRQDPVGVWTGTEWLVWGGWDGDALADGARFDPVGSRWSPMEDAGAPSPRSLAAAVWTGARMLVWGGWDGWEVTDAHRLGDGAAYDPAGNSWTPMVAFGAPTARYLHGAAWSDAHGLMFVWGGLDDRATQSGAAYDPVAGAWTPTSTWDAPPARLQHGALWTGSELLVWGGYDGRLVLGDGALYVP